MIVVDGFKPDVDILRSDGRAFEDGGSQANDQELDAASAERANNRRSAGVSAKSSTAEASTEAFFRRKLETAACMIDIAGVEARMGAGHHVRPLPQRL